MFIIDVMIGNFMREGRARKDLETQKAKEEKKLRIEKSEKEWEEYNRKRNLVDPQTRKYVYHLIDQYGDGHHLECNKCHNDTFICEVQFGTLADMKCCKCGQIMRMRDGGTSGRHATLDSCKEWPVVAISQKR